MCRRCGEPDRRGSAKDRRARRDKLLSGMGVDSPGGNGTVTVCTWCLELLGAVAGYLWVKDEAGRPAYLKVHKLEQDRVDGLGSPYRMDNLTPSCGPCNRERTYALNVIPEGCEYGPEVATA